MYVYKRNEPGLWTVGFYQPDGQWARESDHGSPAAAAARVRYLNGGDQLPAGGPMFERHDAAWQIGNLVETIDRIGGALLDHLERGK